MAKKLSQSDPVDYKDLYKRLEAVAKDREAKERKSNRSSKTIDFHKHLRRDSTSSATASLKSPPPPTAYSTRPVSSIPHFDIPDRGARPSRLSFSGSAKRLSVRSGFDPFLTTELAELVQNSKLVANVDSRPSTSWSIKQHGGLHSHAVDEALLATVRPRSALTVANAKASQKQTDGEAVYQLGSMRNVQLNLQPLSITSQLPSFGMTSPATMTSEDVISPTLDLPARDMSIDGCVTQVSDFSTATTEVAAHSSSSSRSDRKSWNPKSFITRFKDSRTPVEGEMIMPMQEPQISSVPPIHEFTFAKVTPSQHAQIGTNLISPAWDKPIPRPQTEASEPFRFYDYRFSDTSDMTSVRASNTHTVFTLDVDSASINGGEDIPTLMAGAERQAETSTPQNETQAKRDSHAIHPQTIQEPTTRRPYRESTLRREVSMHEAFDFHPDLALEMEPPEDDGIVINFNLDDPGPAPLVQPKDPQVEPERLLQPEATQPEDQVLQESQSVKRRTFDPRQLFVSPKLFSQKRNSAIPASNKSDNEATFSAVNFQQTLPLSTSRPPTRSQPIIIMPHHQQMPVPFSSQPLQVYSGTLPARSTPSLPSTTVPTTSTDPSQGRPRRQSHIPIVPKIPSVPAFELAHMTPQSLALLREQEQILVRRSTLGASSAPNLELIGVAISSDATFQRPPMPAIPASLLVPQQVNGTISKELVVADKGDVSRSSSIATTGHLHVRQLPGASHSMIDLRNNEHDSNKTNVTQSQFASGNTAQRRTKWWKPWKRV